MKVRATIGLTIDIDSEREMGLEIDNDEIENYAIENMIEYLYERVKYTDLGDVISVEILEEEQQVVCKICHGNIPACGDCEGASV